MLTDTKIYFKDRYSILHILKVCVSLRHFPTQPVHMVKGTIV